MNHLSYLLLPALLLGCAVPDNPPVTQEIAWVDAETEELARRACYDCHSNETDWKGMHKIPGVNGWVVDHVLDGRCAVNFSEWDGPNGEAWDSIEEVLDGEMPMKSYTRFRARGRLSDAEIDKLVDGMEATFALDPPRSGSRCGD